MLNVKKYVRKILADSSDITALVPATKILSAYPDEVVNFPCIIYEEQGQNDVELATICRMEHVQECASTFLQSRLTDTQLQQR
jgi:hypothetical protein